MQEVSLLGLLPELGVGLAAIGALAYLSKTYIDRIERQDIRFISEISTREAKYNDLEKEVRDNVLAQLQENTRALNTHTESLVRIHDRLAVLERFDTNRKNG